MTPWFVTLAAVASLVAAWWYPSTVASAALGWTSTVLFVAALAPKQARIKRLFVAGCLTYCGGFYWLFSTIKDFGGFPLVAAVPIFLLYVVGSAVQFVMWAFLWGRIPKRLSSLGLTTALSWLLAVHFWIRIFPWDFGHTQIAFLPLAQMADTVGVTGITALMMWVAEAFVRRKKVWLGARISSVGCLVMAVLYGSLMQEFIPTQYSTELNTLLVQGNVSLSDKHNSTFITVNRDRYLRSSAEMSSKDTLIVWPESTITDFIPTSTTHATENPLLPHLNDGSAFLVGGLTYRSRREFYNSSLLVRPDGALEKPYHKIILMPFGEYTPLADIFPWLATINATAGQFSAGTSSDVMRFPLSSGVIVPVSPLICYEDVIPRLARAATRNGAELLVNQTNDAWFGDSVAPYQHHMIASFRAIENRRFLLRSTNTGLTAIVDPLGRTLSSLKPFTESTLQMEVNLLNYSTNYTTWPVEAGWFCTAVATLIALLTSAFRTRRKGTTLS